MKRESRSSNKTRELETHHNQALTPGARARTKFDNEKKLQKKVVALQLDPKEQLAMKYLGGIKGLKALLCPEGVCVGCRQNQAHRETYLEAFCLKCAAERSGS